MNWKLIFLLSLPGLALSFATVYIIPNNIAIYLWIAVYVFCAFVMAKKNEATQKYSSKPYWSIVFVGYLMSIWIGTVHYVFFDAYVSFQPKVLEQLKNSPEARWRLLVTNLVVGFFLSKILLILNFLAALILKKLKPKTTDVPNT
jgi:hypothetical protein